MRHLLFTLLPLTAFAQEMTGPTLGWSRSDDGRAMQAIYGVAGAARLGPAVNWPGELTDILVSPTAQRAVASENGVAVLVDLVTRQRTPLPDAPAGEARVWSPLGTALLIANRESGQVKVYRQQGSIFAGLDNLTLAADSYAVSDDGSSIFAASGDDLLLRTPQGASILGRKSAGFTFLARTNTPVFVEGSDLVIGNIRFPLSINASLLDSPAAGRILAIDQAAGKLVWYDDQGTLLAETSCNCAIDRLERLGSAGTQRLVTSGEGPVWLAETSALANRLFFVPKVEVE